VGSVACFYTPVVQVLRLIHGRVIDTAALFCHPSGLPFKHSLKKLAKDYLGREIQDGGSGINPFDP
jgi:RNA exonuclease 1